MDKCMIIIENRYTGGKHSRRADNRSEAMTWISQQLENNPYGRNRYWLASEPSKIYKSVADFPVTERPKSIRVRR